MSASLFGFFLLLGLLLTVGLYVAIERETSNTRVMDRAEAERTVQQRGGPGGGVRGGDASGQTGNSAAEQDEDAPGHDRPDEDTE